LKQLLLVGLWAGLGASQAEALGLFIQGTEARAHGGGGLVPSHGAPALFHNPAQLAVKNSSEFYTELSYISVNYGFTYPGQSTYNYQTSGLIPFAGYTGQASPALSWSLVLMPIPPSVTRITLRDILTRETGDEPVPVNVKRSSGQEFGFMGAVGVSYRWLENFSSGLSLSFDRQTSEERIEYGDGQLLRESRVRELDTELRLGLSYQALQKRLLLSLAVVPWRQKSEKGTLKQLAFPDFETANIDDKGQGPMEYGFGLGWDQGAWALTAETVYSNWESLGQNRGLVVDYRDTWDRSLAFSYRLDSERSATIGYGFAPSYLGDGVMKTRTANYVEVRGFSYGDVDALPRTLLSLAYRFPLLQQRILAYLLNQRAERVVGEAAKAYGKHQLDFWMAGFSCQLNL
jgi:hypothetical protein